MSGTFSSLQTALDALRYQRVAMDVASSNIANVDTDGYTRRRVEGASTAVGGVQARWSVGLDSGGGSVRVAGVTRMSDALLVARSQREHATASFLSTRQATLAQIDNNVAEPSDTGLTSALAGLTASWQAVGNKPDSSATRQAVLAKAQTVVETVHSLGTILSTAASDRRAGTLSEVAAVNSATTVLADVNRGIMSARLTGADAGSLLDQRDALVSQLSQLTGGSATIAADGSATFTISGTALVSGGTAGSLAVASGIAADGSADGQPLTFSVTLGATTTPTGMAGGSLGASVELLDQTIPAQRASLNAAIKALADETNARHQAGFDQDGTAGGTFFSYDPADPVGSLSVAITDPRKLAAAAIGGGVIEGSNALTLGTPTSADDKYQSWITTLGITTSTATQLLTNQNTIVAQVDDAHQQLAGVSLDEETVNLMAAQRAYEAAARVMSTVDAVLDTLINRTGAR